MARTDQATANRKGNSAVVLALTSALFLPAGLVAVNWHSTALIQVPLHRRLAGGFDPSAARRLVVTNWWRTAACPPVTEAMPLTWFKRQGLVPLTERYLALQTEGNRRGT